MLSTNTDIDIEIGTSAKQLPKEQEIALNKLRELHKDAKILIKTNLYNEAGNKRVLFDNGVSVQSATVRFITEPVIKDKYTYISDIDIVSLDRNFYESHIEDMRLHNRTYSNIIRKDIPRLSGLHFCETEKQYPLDLTGIDIAGWNEVILLEVTARNQHLDYETTWRPVHGIHMSANRPSVEGTDSIPGWFPEEWDYCEDHDDYKKKWYEFKRSKEFECIIPTIKDNIVGTMIKKLERYYRYKHILLFRKRTVKYYNKLVRRIKRYINGIHLMC